MHMLQKHVWREQILENGGADCLKFSDSKNQKLPSLGKAIKKGGANASVEKTIQMQPLSLHTRALHNSTLQVERKRVRHK